MTTPTPGTTPTPNPCAIRGTTDGGCAHWFYWITPSLIAYCQDCPHSWTVSRPQSVGTRRADPLDGAQRGCSGPADGAGARR